jgi:hypothetical protein
MRHPISINALGKAIKSSYNTTILLKGIPVGTGGVLSKVLGSRRFLSEILDCDESDIDFV